MPRRKNRLKAELQTKSHDSVIVESVLSVFQFLGTGARRLFCTARPSICRGCLITRTFRYQDPELLGLLLSDFAATTSFGVGAPRSAPAESLTSSTAK